MTTKKSAATVRGAKLPLEIHEASACVKVILAQKGIKGIDVDQSEQTDLNRCLFGINDKKLAHISKIVSAYFKQVDLNQA